MKQRFARVLLFILGFAVVQQSVLQAEFSLFKRGDSELERLTVLKRVIYLVNENYVEPQRIKAGEMYQAVLKRLEEQIPEVRLLLPESSSMILSVNRERLTLNKDMMNVFSLTPAISKVLLFVKKNLVSKEITDEQLEQLAIHGVLSTLDPHSTYLSKEVWEQTRIETIQGSFGGVGIVISSRNGKLMIIAPLDDTPAARAGLMAGDVIQRINDESTINMDTNQAADLMRGPKGTPVTILVMRDTFTAPKEFKLTRAIIKTQSVEYQSLPDKIAFIRVKNFQANTTNDVRRYLNQAREQQGSVNGIILDLRNDPGGLLAQAVELTDLFVDQGTIVSTVNRANREERREVASGRSPWSQVPMAVLVNSGSASASEIVAGAIKYLDRGMIIGRRTFGKSSVQQLFELPENAALKLTTEKYQTSNGQSLQSVGIVPDMQLNPVRVDDELVSLYGSSMHMGEESLEGHLNANTQQEQVQDSRYSLQYLTQKSSEASEYQPIKNPLQDFEIAFAHRALNASKTTSRKQQLKELKLFVDKEQSAQREKIATALATKKIAWSSRAANNKSTKNCSLPQLQISAGVGDKPIKAGSDIELNVEVNNKASNCTWTDLWAMTQADEYFINQRELLIGNVEAGSSKQAKVKIRLPEYLPSRLVYFKLQFFSDSQALAWPADYQFHVNGLPLPRFSYYYHLQELPGTNQGTSVNQKLEKGENVRLQLKVTNTGEGASKENVAILKNLSGAGVFLKRGRAELGEITPKQVKDVDFEFEIRPYFDKDTIEFELQVYDSQYAKFVSNKISVKLGEVLHDQDDFTPPRIDLDPKMVVDKVASAKFYTVRGKLSDATSLKDFYITVNKNKVYYQAYGAESKAADFSAVIPLEKGTNNIVITVRDGDNFIEQERMVLLYRPQEAKLEPLTLN